MYESPESIQPALIYPYTLFEEEALAWSILLCNQAVLLHPFPLPLPPSYLPLMDQGLLQVRSLERTREEIRIKERNLRAVQTYIAGLPDQGFLKTLKGLTSGEALETQEEIVGLLKGETSKKNPEYPSAIDGQTLLCLIHQWLMQEWEMEASVAMAEEQEKTLTMGWQENPEETVTWSPPVPSVLRKNETELPCPLALTAWKELRDQLAPEPLNLFTTQWWAWTEHYGLDPDEEPPVSIPLPDLGPLDASNFQKQLEARGPSKTGSTVSRFPEGPLRSLLVSPQEGAIVDFQKALSGLGLPPNGRYCLILPPIKLSLKGPEAYRRQNGWGPLILLSLRPFGLRG